ncbi:MAG: hypothetical protein FWB80_05395 [Defluviitaleaceae bacterium]|nr:hypothetical protein [Defluviitaleaceae bacterium]
MSTTARWVIALICAVIVFPLISFGIMWWAGPHGEGLWFIVSYTVVSVVFLLGWVYVLYSAVKQESKALIRLFLFFWAAALGAALFGLYINSLYVVWGSQSRLSFFLFMMFNASFVGVFFPFGDWIRDIYDMIFVVPIVMLAAGVFVRIKFKGEFYYG